MLRRAAVAHRAALPRLDEPESWLTTVSPEPWGLHTAPVGLQMGPPISALSRAWVSGGSKLIQRRSSLRVVPAVLLLELDGLDESDLAMCGNDLGSGEHRHGSRRTRLWRNDA